MYLFVSPLSGMLSHTVGAEEPGSPELEVGVIEEAKREDELRRPVPGRGGRGGVGLADLVVSLGFEGLGDGAADEVLVDNEGLRERDLGPGGQRTSLSISMAIGRAELGVGGFELCGRMEGAERGELVPASVLGC